MTKNVEFPSCFFHLSEQFYEFLQI